jgi:creatinine amidohydrolase
VGLEPPVTDVHAGLLETSQALHLFPQLVRSFEDVVGYVEAQPGWLDRLFAEGVKALSPNGVLGDPRGATADAGRLIIDSLAGRIAAWASEATRVTGRGGV